MKITHGSGTSILDAFEARIEELQSDAGIESATSIEMLDAFKDKIDELEDINNSENIQASYDALYRDTHGMLGDPDATYSEDDLIEFWKANHTADPSMQRYGEDMKSWLRDTKAWLSEFDDVAACDVTASINLTEEQEDLLWDIAESYTVSTPKSGDWDTELAHEQAEIAKQLKISMNDAKQLMIEQLGFTAQDWSTAACSDISHQAEEIDEDLRPVKGSDAQYDIFMLMYYDSDPGAGIDGDNFTCLGKFFGESLDEAKVQLEECKAEYPDVAEAFSGPYSDLYVDEFNSYFDDGEEVYSDLSVLFKQMHDNHVGHMELFGDDPDLPFN